jgi:glutathione S-transferase
VAEFTLVIGNKNYSSWSLRPWLTLRHAGIEFDEILIPLDESGTKAAILKHSASGRVPALKHGDLTVWDSLAICEYTAEQRPGPGCGRTIPPPGRSRARSRPRCTPASRPCVPTCR